MTATVETYGFVKILYRTDEKNFYSGINVKWVTNEKEGSSESDDSIKPIVIIGAVLSACAFLCCFFAFVVLLFRSRPRRYRVSAYDELNSSNAEIQSIFIQIRDSQPEQIDQIMPKVKFTKDLVEVGEDVCSI
jgi:hypothetical protein